MLARTWPTLVDKRLPHALEQRHHRLHWLGVTTNLGDRLLGTHPRAKTDVPLSATARTLR